MLRRLFGKPGFGAALGKEEHRAVPLILLRELTGLVELGVELRTRRLLWLHSALVAENGGELRLDRPQWQAQQVCASIFAPAG